MPSEPKEGQMWGNRNPEPPARPAGPEKQATTPASNPPIKLEEKKMSPMEPFNPAGGNGARLGASLDVKGEITGNEDLQIDGTVEGTVQLDDRKLTVGASAKVTADIVAREVVVYGNVKGNLRARDRIEIKKDGSVVGDLTTARIMIEDGAYFKGSIEIDKTGEAAGANDKPSFVRSVTSVQKTVATASD
jgi:cytoskeletal protein CcmA (bactofilin family)